MSLPSRSAVLLLLASLLFVSLPAPAATAGPPLADALPAADLRLPQFVLWADPAPSSDPAATLLTSLKAEGLLDDRWSLSPYHERTSPLGTHVRHQILHEALPVLNHEAVIHINADGQAYARTTTLTAPLPAIFERSWSLSPDRSAQVALAAVDPVHGQVIAQQAGWYATADATVPAYQVDVVVPVETLAPRDVRVHVDATTGKVLALEERGAAQREGTASVFPVSPMVAARDFNMTDLPLGAAPLDPYIDERPVLGLSEAVEDTGRLKGDHVQVLGTALALLDDWHHPRAALEFQEVMAYWHTDLLQRRVQALGFDDANNHSQLIAAANVPGLANAFYSPTQDFIVFGSHGGTFANGDAAEDPEAIIHENGHAIQRDIVPNWGGGDAGAMGEGFSDFLAGAVLSPWSGGFGDDCVAEWWTSHIYGGSRPCLREMDNDFTYSELGHSGVHTAGQIWSGLLYDLWQNDTADVALRISLAATYLMTGGHSMADAADLLIVADRLLYDGAHEALIAHSAYDREIAGPLALEIAGHVDPPATGARYHVTEIMAQDVNTTGWSEISGQDDSVTTISIASTWFYGQLYDQLNVSDNGFVSLTGSQAGCCSGGLIPDADGVGGLIAGAWTDLEPGAGGRIAYLSGTNVTRISFEEVPHLNGAGVVSFRIDIRTTGTIEVHLLRVDGGSGMITTGIEDESQTLGHQLRRTTSGLESPLAWRLDPGTGVEYHVGSLEASTANTTGWTVLQMLDDEVESVAIPSTPFYGTEATTLHVSSNGFVSLHETRPAAGCCGPGDLPSQDGIDGIVAGLWTDLNPKSCGTVAYTTDAVSTRVAYDQVPYYGQSCSDDGRKATFWMELWNNGTIDVHLNRVDGGAMAATGIEATNGTVANETRRTDAALTEATAWRFVPQDLDEDPGPDPEPEPVDPHTATHHVSGRLACAFSLGPVNANDACANIGDSSQTSFTIPVERGATAVHVEIHWTPNVDHGAQTLQYQWTLPHLGAGVGPSPLVTDHEVDPDAFFVEEGTHAIMTVQLADDEGLVVDQAFEACIVFQYGGAPLPEDACMVGASGDTED